MYDTKFLAEGSARNKNNDSGIDCVFAAPKNKCAILSVSKCLGNKCTFRKSSAEISSSDSGWKDHLNSMDSAKQSKIASEYYGGKMPWKDKRSDK